MSSINGILPLYKPIGPTSHDMVSWLRKKLNTKKIGHSGTLDPFAEGVLVMGIGKGTRILEYLKDEKKTYTMTFRLGLLTDTYDIEGQVISDEAVNIQADEINEVVGNMKGVQKQVPPVYSAKKYKGKKLYEYAREGKIIKMPPREITVFSIEVLSIQGRDVTIQAVVSPGTYMRSLAFDIGLKLSTNASAIKLVRDMNGRFSTSECMITDDLSHFNPDVFSRYLKTIGDSLSDFPKVKVKSCFEGNVLNGNPIRMEWVEEYGTFKKDALLQIVNQSEELIAVGCAQRNDSFLKTLKEQNRDEIIVKVKKVFGEIEDHERA